MGKTAFLFSGQGAQYPGMMADICAGYIAARQVFEQADELLGYRLSELVFNGPAEKLNQTVYTQPALLVCEAAVFAVLRQHGLQCQYMEGFSLGEWAALAAAGVLPFEQALFVVQKRARYMQEAVPLGCGGMAVVLGKGEEEVEALCARAGQVTIANYNCPGQFAVAGTAEGIASLLALAAKEGVLVKELPISIPSHCRLMQPAAERLDQALQDAVFADAAVPIVMNCTAQPEQNGVRIRQNMIRQLTCPVYFEKSVLCMLQNGVDTFVEIGPGKTLTGLVKRTAKAAGATVTVFRTGEQALLEELLQKETE